MSVYIYIHMKLYIRTRTYIHEQHIYIHTYTRIYTRIHTHIHTRTHTHTKRILVGHLVHIIRPSRRIRSVISRGGSVSPLRGLNIARGDLLLNGRVEVGVVAREVGVGLGGGLVHVQIPSSCHTIEGRVEKGGLYLRLGRGCARASNIARLNHPFDRRIEIRVVPGKVGIRLGGRLVHAEVASSRKLVLRGIEVGVVSLLALGVLVERLGIQRDRRRARRTQRSGRVGAEGDRCRCREPRGNLRGVGDDR
mmetsp:Transcript_35519/g.52150  ORF Transcript_35519/g.52150 Transcript_35519/m.52150 type:complete len:250 (-) Transcript_35519:52-801(-)